MNKIDLLYMSGKIIFSIDDIRLLWHENNADALKSSVKYHVDKKRLLRIKKGIYALSNNYDVFELAQKLLRPSYISLLSALAFYGITFQAEEEVTSMALYWRRYSINGVNYIFHLVGKEIFFNPIGIKKEKNYWIATKERAITDTIYLKGESAFDNIGSVDKELLRKLANIYNQKTTRNLICKLINSL